MPLRFPDVTDVPLKKSPLSEVICQVRFPANFGIGQGLPVAFQKSVRHRFPEVTEVPNLAMIQILGQEPTQPGRVFQFRSIRGDKMVSLTVDSFSVSTSAYTTWEEFSQDLSLINETVQELYDIPYAKRIGLRYVNQISSQLTGLKALEELQSLIQPALVSPLQVDVWDDPDEFIVHLLLDDGGPKLAFRTAAAKSEDDDPTIILDFDYYEEGQMPLSDLTDRCDGFHDVIYRGFRWALTPRGFSILEAVANRDEA